MDLQDVGDSTCPFCPFFDSDSNVVGQHVQYCHPENEPQAELWKSSRDAPGTNLDSQLSVFSGLEGENDGPHRVEDRLDHQESIIPKHAFLPQSHVQNEGTGKKSAKLHSSPYDDRIENPLRMNSKSTPNGSIRRLGRTELGPYAREKKMPLWLLRMLEKGNTTTKLNKITPYGNLSRHLIADNETPNVVPALAQLCEQDKSVKRAFLCSTNVRHISKMPREGGFCGYRNIQMLISYIRESRNPGSDHFPGTLPTVLQLQDMIERAWDMGYNSLGRIETGGIKGTRKYIGTSEAQALFLSLGIQCEASSIGNTKGMPAHSSLLSHIAAYFKSACPLDETEKVVLTNLPPMYFQHHGHSMTMVGFEIRDQGRANILVFDPMFKSPSVIKHATNTKIKTSEPARILTGYRKGVNYLQKYQTFELLNEMRTSPNIIITGTPGVGKTVHCEQVAENTGLRHLSINQVAKDRGCYDTYDEQLNTWVVDEDKLLDAIEDEVLQGGYLIDWHACDLFPKSWVDLVVVLRCPSTTTLYDRLNSRGYHDTKLQENLDAEIFGVLIEEAREAFDEEVVVELNSEENGDVEANCARISSWIDDWKSNQAKNSD
ncbi:DUF1671-domain-containing protein [Aspergillus aurantiobrunneus]